MTQRVQPDLLDAMKLAANEASSILKTLEMAIASCYCVN